MGNGDRCITGGTGAALRPLPRFWECVRVAPPSAPSGRDQGLSVCTCTHVWAGWGACTCYTLFNKQLNLFLPWVSPSLPPTSCSLVPPHLAPNRSHSRCEHRDSSPGFCISQAGRGEPTPGGECPASGASYRPCPPGSGSTGPVSAPRHDCHAHRAAWKGRVGLHSTCTVTHPGSSAPGRPTGLTASPPSSICGPPASPAPTGSFPAATSSQLLEQQKPTVSGALLQAQLPSQQLHAVQAPP